MTLQEMIADVHALKEDLVTYERKYGVLSETFYEQFSFIHPHHKHIDPDIKHHRIPAPNMSFTQPNLAALIQEIEKLIEAPTTASV